MTVRKLVAAVALSVTASAPAVASGTPESVFHIDRSKNDNQVHYAIRLDDDCAPEGTEPVEAYWLRRRPDGQETAPITWIQQRAYGIAAQTVDGSSVRIELRALPAREIVIRTGLATAPASSTGAGGESLRNDAQAETAHACSCGKAGTESAAGGNPAEGEERQEPETDSIVAQPPACHAEAFTSIDGRDARLLRVYVASKEGLFLPTVLHVDLFGETADGERVQERILPD